MRNKKRSTSYIYYMLRSIWGNSANLKRTGLLLSFYFAFCYQSAKAEAIPLSIIDLCNLSDIVVSAKIIDVIPAEKIPDYSYSIARLNIISVLKGIRENSEILIHYNPYVACPPSPQFNEKSYVIVFIDYLEDRSIHTVFASGRGVLELSEARIQVFENKIKELVPLLENMQYNIEKITEWLVSSFENPVIRDEAARGLVLGVYKDFFSPDARRSGEKYSFSALLDKNQKSRLYEAILKSKHFKYPEFTIIQFCNEFYDDRLIPVLTAYVKSNAEEPYFLTFEIISLISDIMELDEGKKIVAEDKALAGDPARWDNRRKLVGRFIELIETSK